MATKDADLDDSTIASSAEPPNAPTLEELYGTAPEGSFQNVMFDGIQAITKFLAGVPYRNRREDRRQMREVRKVQARFNAALAKSRAAQR